MDDRKLQQRRAQLTFTLSNTTGASNSTVVNATVPAPASSAASAATAKEMVVFHICPDTELSFKDTFSLIESMPPIRLETPARHPIEIICLKAEKEKEGNLTTATPQTTTTTMTKGGSCVMSGGDVHILIEHVPHAVDALPSTLTVEKKDHPITIKGVTFRGASNTSILMNDPRGNITFKACSWEDNVGEATMIIDGRFNASTTDDGSDAEELEPLYPDEPTSPPVDDGTDDLVIDFDDPEDMTVSFESTSTSSTMSLQQMTTTVANELDDDNFTPEVQSKADKNPDKDDSVVEVEQSSTSATIVNDAEAETSETSFAPMSDDLLGFDFGNRRLGLPDDGSIEEDEGLSSIIDIGDLEESGTSMRAMQSLEMEEVLLRSKISVEGCSFRVSLSGVTPCMFVVISSSIICLLTTSPAMKF